MTRLAVSSNKLIPQSPRTIFLLSLLFLASLFSACSSSPKSSSSDSSSTAPTSPVSSGSPSAASGGSNFEGTITAKMFGSTQPVEVRYAIKGARSRVETQLSQGGTATGVMLMDTSSGSQTMLMPQTKTYMDLNKDGMFKQMADKMAQEASKDGMGDISKLTSTGKTETIAGFNCHHWVMGDAQNTDLCLAQGLGYFGGGQAGSLFDKFKNLVLGDKAKAQLSANPEFAKFVEGGAFPLKISQVENGQSKTILEVTNVERKSLDDSLFSIPPDYKKMEIPGLPTGR